MLRDEQNVWDQEKRWVVQLDARESELLDGQTKNDLKLRLGDVVRNGDGEMYRPGSECPNAD